MHPRSRHHGRYDFALLIRSWPELARFVATNPHGNESIDFADPEAVKALNKAILKHFYGVAVWDIPTDYLCPPIPGRADYIHSIADLLGSCQGDVIPRGDAVRVLDIGVGANCVYPLIGHSEYGWRFLGSDTDPVALAAARKIVESNGGFKGAIELRLQGDSPRIFSGLLREGETFDVSICNPPFHASLEEAQAGTRRKWSNLGKAPRPNSPLLNFGGQSTELWCPGGEVAFIRRMIEESAQIPDRCVWFTTLVSKESNLPPIYAALERAKPEEVHTTDLSQGQKKSRVVAWTFQTGMSYAPGP